MGLVGWAIALSWVCSLIGSQYNFLKVWNRTLKNAGQLLMASRVMQHTCVHSASVRRGGSLIELANTIMGKKGKCVARMSRQERDKLFTDAGIRGFRAVDRVSRVSVSANIRDNAEWQASPHCG